MNGDQMYQDDRHEEMIDGEVMAMAPSPAWSHVSVAGNIYRIFGNYLQDKKGIPIPNGLDLHLTDDVFIPDMMVVCDQTKLRPNGVHGAPDLVVEVLSPSTARKDRIRKKNVYERCGVPEYWIVSPYEKTIEVYWLDGGKYILHDICTLPSDWEMNQLTDREKTEVVTEFKCHLYDDLIIRLEDIFFDFL